METTYLYSVNPKKIIKDLPIPPIRSPRSLYLTKDQVLICLKSGTVYRRFAAENRNERVTILNVDRLHNDKYMTEEEYKLFLESKVNDQRGSITTTTVEDEKKETIKNDDVIKEEEKNDEHDTLQSDANTGDDTDEVVEDTEEVDDETEELEESVVEESTDKTEHKNTNNQYNRNKKYNKRNRK